jgi:phosphoserine phosphatase SerB
MNIKLVLFDMDGTLLDGRTIQKFAEEKGFQNELQCLLKSEKKFYEITIDIAKLLKEMKKTELLKIFRKIPLQDNVEKVIQTLKSKNIKTAIITDSYQFVADDLKKRLKIDYAFANNLVSENGRFTGEIILNNKELIEEPINKEIYSICKSCVLEDICDKLYISQNEVIAVGDGFVDIGMLKKSGIGIAFNAPEKVQKHADVTTNNLIDILEYI